MKPGWGEECKPVKKFIYVRSYVRSLQRFLCLNLEAYSFLRKMCFRTVLHVENKAKRGKIIFQAADKILF